VYSEVYSPGYEHWETCSTCICLYSFFVWTLNSDLPIAEKTLKMSQRCAALRVYFYCFW